MDEYKKQVAEELAKLNSLAGMIESDEFQEYIYKPLQAELDKLKDAYDCDSLRELATLKGKKWGLQQFFNKVKDTHGKIRSLREDLK